jgi:tRNA-2-methylthio-N6-dimethylallyladenosine synthase
MQKVLVEGPSKGNESMLTGRTESNKVVVFEGSPDLINNVIEVKIIEDHLWYFVGRVEK